MNFELKQEIVSCVFKNVNVFGLHNFMTDQFAQYIYNKDGDYLIGGKQVSEFIDRAIKLIMEG